VPVDPLPEPSEGVGFEPTVRFPVRLISSQVPSTAQPPFLCEGEEDSKKVRVVEGNGGANGRNGERARGRIGLAGVHTRLRNTPSLHYSGGETSRTRTKRTADRQPLTANPLIHFFPFGIRLALAEELVVIGELVHQHPDEADNIWSHGVEPLRGFDEENTGAHETAGGDDTDTGIHPSNNRIGIQ
jgi:hypothetical protein